MAQLLGIARRGGKRAAMEPLQSAGVTLERGVADDFRGRPGRRQVTLLTREGWQAACAELGESTPLPWTLRRANLLIEGVDLRDSAGRLLRIGELELLVTMETDPCERMEAVHPGLFDALAREWRGGVCCRVRRPGHIRIGDTVVLCDVD